MNTLELFVSWCWTQKPLLWYTPLPSLIPDILKRYILKFFNWILPNRSIISIKLLESQKWFTSMNNWMFYVNAHYGRVQFNMTPFDNFMLQCYFNIIFNYYMLPWDNSKNVKLFASSLITRAMQNLILSREE